jgi:DNA-binding transcriptional MerR regulator
VGYTAAQASRLAGCNTAQLDTWHRIGLVVPDDADPAAPYSFRDLVALRMVVSLLETGLPMRRIQRAVAELLRTGDDLSGLRLVTDGDTVWACRDDGQILDALRQGQLALFVAVDRFADEVEAEVREFDADRRAFLAELRARDEHPSRG